MAAPTVGAVMADILPYLGVEKNASAQDQPVCPGDLTGLTRVEAEKQLKQLGLTALCAGPEDTVTAQIPAAEQSVPQGSQVLLYFGEEADTRQVEVPDFLGMNRQQAADAAGKLGLYILPQGNPELSPQVTVTAQSEAKDTLVPTGTTITLTFTDTAAKD